MKATIRNFLQMESAGGIVLMGAAVLALIAANSPLSSYYDLFIDTPVEIRIGRFEIAKPLLLWVNDGLMAVFFFLVGLEVKRELLEGELSRPANVMLPLIADKVLASIELISGACAATARAVAGFTINHGQVEQALARNPILVTALNTRIGYGAAAAIAKRAYAEQRPVIDVAAEETGISRQELAALLDPARLAGL